MLEVHLLASGSDGNCTVIESDGEAIMIDAGISCRRIMSLMEVAGIDKESVKAILITHEHADHISGAGATARKLDVPIMTNISTSGECEVRPCGSDLQFRGRRDECHSPPHIP